MSNIDQNKQLGCFQVARSLFNHDFWLRKPAWWVKVWIYILGKVNHADRKDFKRGEGHFTYEQIYYECQLKNDGVSNPRSMVHVMVALKNRDMIVTRKVTRGMRIKVRYYNEYQKLSSYRSDTESDAGSDTRVTQKLHRSDTINKNVKNVKNVKKGELEKWLSVLKEKTGTISSPKGLEGNFEYWRESYSLKEMLEAINWISHHDWLSDKVKPQLILRRRDRSQQPVDRIGELLTLKKKKQLIRPWRNK